MYIFATILLFFSLFFLWQFALQAEEVPLLPERPFDRYVIYESLIFFWVFIVALVIIIRMKLKEIERVQKMGIDSEEKDAPLLD